MRGPAVSLVRHPAPDPSQDLLRQTEKDGALAGVAQWVACAWRTEGSWVRFLGKGTSLGCRFDPRL